MTRKRLSPDDIEEGGSLISPFLIERWNKLHDTDVLLVVANQRERMRVMERLSSGVGILFASALLTAAAIVLIEVFLPSFAQTLFVRILAGFCILSAVSALIPGYLLNKISSVYFSEIGNVAYQYVVDFNMLCHCLELPAETVVPMLEKDILARVDTLMIRFWPPELRGQTPPWAPEKYPNFIADHLRPFGLLPEEGQPKKPSLRIVN